MNELDKVIDVCQLCFYLICLLKKYLIVILSRRLSYLIWLIDINNKCRNARENHLMIGKHVNICFYHNENVNSMPNIYQEER